MSERKRMKKILPLLSFGLALGAGVTVVANGAEALDALRRLDRAKR